MKKLLVSGDSFSSGWPLESSFRIWPDILAEKLDMECVNFAEPGAGNEHIFSTLLDAIVDTPKKDIGLVFAMWSEFPRLDFESVDGWVKTRPRKWWRNKSIPNNLNWELSSYLKELGIGIKDAPFSKSMRYFFSFQNICENMKIDYFQMQGILPCVRSRWMLKSPFADKIDETTFIGWPIVSELLGYCLLDELSEKHVRHEDLHPNEEGHKYIAEFLYGIIRNEGQKRTTIYG